MLHEGCYAALQIAGVEGRRRHKKSSVAGSWIRSGGEGAEMASNKKPALSGLLVPKGRGCVVVNGFMESGHIIYIYRRARFYLLHPLTEHTRPQRAILLYHLIDSETCH
jgi:hypothetical protein